MRPYSAAATASACASGSGAAAAEVEEDESRPELSAVEGLLGKGDGASLASQQQQSSSYYAVLAGFGRGSPISESAAIGSEDSYNDNSSEGEGYSDYEIDEDDLVDDWEDLSEGEGEYVDDNGSAAVVYSAYSMSAAPPPPPPPPPTQHSARRRMGQDLGPPAGAGSLAGGFLFDEDEDEL